MLISLLLAWHVTAVFLAPLSVEPTSPLVGQLVQGPIVQKYLDLLFINHGYHFFAPEPGNGHLIRYEVFDDRGGTIDQGEFPNKKTNWPRLLYHRYFMLAEQCEVGAPTDAEASAWRDAYLKNYARQILREYPTAAAVRVRRVVHYTLLPEDAVRIATDPSLEEYRGNPLAYPPTYKVEAEVTQRRQDLEQPAPIPGEAALPSGAWNGNWRQDVAAGWQGGVR